MIRCHLLLRTLCEEVQTRKGRTSTEPGLMMEHVGTVDDSIADDNSELPNELQHHHNHHAALSGVASLVGDKEDVSVEDVVGGVDEDATSVVAATHHHQLQLEHQLAQLHKQHQELLQRAQADQVLELQRAQQLAHHIEQAQRAHQQQQQVEGLDVAAHLGLHDDDDDGAVADGLSAHVDPEQQLLLQQQQLEAQIQQAAMAQHQVALVAQHQLLAEGIPLAQPGMTGEGPSRYHRKK